MLLHQGVCILLIRNSILHRITIRITRNAPVFLTIVVLCDFRGEDETRNFTPLCPLLLVLWLSVRVPDFYLNSSLCASLLFSTTRMASLEVLEDELMMEERSIRFDDSLDLEENIENKITLVGLLIADHEPTQGIVKDVLRAIWTNMGQVKVLKAKENVYSITVGDEAVASRIIDGRLLPQLWTRGCSGGPAHAGGFEDLQAPTISKASTHLFLQRHVNRNAKFGMDLNKWRGRLERESDGLYGLSGVVESEYVQTFVRTQQTRAQTNPTTNTRSAVSSLQPEDLQSKTNSPRIHHSCEWVVSIKELVRPGQAPQRSLSWPKGDKSQQIWGFSHNLKAVVAGLEQPQGDHDTTILELSRFGESLDNSLFEGAPSFKKSHCGFSYGNKTEQPQYKELEETVWLS
ncbi:hypothetical protein L3X38_033375 [Prunus dulcis]|uniref:DUF4283 domain-containing protein n=1 Tax=Prunus dulcis TaxID=3755 RepID=A0AAD4VI63_PRUDU|nr:hypothetical protein L3X38_033375 [Prunus dulcis]